MLTTPKTPGAAAAAAAAATSKRLQSAAKPAAAAVAAQGAQALTSSALLDAFPVWTDQLPVEKDDKSAGKYEDALGLSLPPSAEPFCDAWKRAEELLQGTPSVPLVCLKPGAAADVPAAGDGKRGGAKVAVTSRELDGKLYAGHDAFEWLLPVFSQVMAAEKWLKRGDYLWELIHPKDKEGLPARSPTGKYRVKLYLLDTWRSVVVDDRIPVDLFGRPLLVGSRPLQLWPLLLCKAVLKVMAAYRSLHSALPHQVAAFQMLTGWPQEDLLDALGGTPLAGGALFNRLEDVLGGPLGPTPQDMPVVASCCLVRRSKPQRAPPRLVVLAGASAVGRSQLVARLVAEYPDKFGVTVSHTSRPPREHEVDGRDFHFTGKQALLAGARAKQFLEAARVAVHSRPCSSSAAAAAAAPPRPTSYWYGTSLSTVREVAATGKLCVMSLDVQGAEALWSNPRIDGLYLYISTSSPEVLAQRQKQRLCEAASTLAKKLAWAKQQVSKSTALGLFDDVINNTGLQEAYAALKEAISKLSPIIRNRLRGLPAYVLDYSDLIPPNSVEKPFLKPVIVAGPHTGERRKLLEMLVQEFPDVFAFPRQHTTRPPDEHSHHVGEDGDELQLLAERAGTACGGGAWEGQRDGTAVAVWEANKGRRTAAPGRDDSAGSGDGAGSDAVLGPAPVVLSKEAFEAAAACGQLLEAHAELFQHPLATHRHGHSLAHLQEVIQAGKLPLLELEAEEVELVKQHKATDCLAVFLAPPSLEVHQQRLEAAATESDKEVAARGAATMRELALVRSKCVFDQVVVNDDAEAGYQQLKAAISRLRPDLIAPAADDAAAAAAARQAATSQPSPVIVLGPAGAGREQLVQQLTQQCAQHFAAPRRLSDRKPGKGDKDLGPDVEFVRPDVLTKLAAQGQVVWSQQDVDTGSSLAVALEALQDILASGKMAVLDIGNATLEQLQALKQQPSMQGAFAVYVCSSALLGSSLAGQPEAAVQAALAKAAADKQAMLDAEGAVQACLGHDEPEESFMQLQAPLSAAYPWAMSPVLQPLVVAGPFGSGKRAMLQKLVRMLPGTLAVPKVVTSKPHGAGEDQGMEVISHADAQQMAADGRFLVHQEVLGHVYGITAASVRRLQAQGKLPLLDLDRVQDVEALQGAGLKATYIYLQPRSVEALRARITSEFLANPPLDYEPQEAAAAAAGQAAAEVAAAVARPGLFDAIVEHEPEDMLATIGRLGQQLTQHYPSAVPDSFVWGFGRPLWDPASRVLGLKPLKVIVLGPAAAGKSTLCASLAARFGVPHVNVGDLLYAEVAAKTAVGLEAQRHMDSSKTVPGHILLDLLLARLQQPDCVAHGWVLDGFPHTSQQAATLDAAGHVPDKVILLEGPHALLQNRVKYRRVDYTTGRVYQLAEAGAMSEAIRPLRHDGSPDADVLARLSVRHDDSPENVANRLALWDRQVQGLRAAYEDVLLRMPAAGPASGIHARAEAFIRLESTLPVEQLGHGPVRVGPVVESWRLEELTYRLVATIRCKRRQLVQLQQLDGKLFWCNLKELAPNCSCMLLGHNPPGLPVLKHCKRLDTSSIQPQQLLLVDSPEPFRLITCLSMGPQHHAVPPPAPAKKVFVLAGAMGAGRASLAWLLLQDFACKLVMVPLLTSRVPLPYELAAAHADASSHQQQQQKQDQQQEHLPASRQGRTSSAISGSCEEARIWPGSNLLQFVPEAEFSLMQQSQQLVGLHSHMAHACAVHTAALQAATQSGRAALVVGSVHLAEQLRQDLHNTEVVCVYVETDGSSRDHRLRQQEAREEQLLQALLHDGTQQHVALQSLLDQQREPPAAQQQGTPGGQAAGPPVPQTPQPGGGGSKGAAGAAPGGGKLAVQLPQAMIVPNTPTAASRTWQPPPQQPWSGGASSVQPPAEPWLRAVVNPDGQLHACYAEVKALLARHWPVQQQFQPGLLLLQHFPASGFGCSGLSRPGSTASGADADSSRASSAASRSSIAAAAAAATTAAPATATSTTAAVVDGAGLGLDEDGLGSATTVLRLRAVTAAASQLLLPRGRHLLALHCCPRLLHCVTFHAASECVLDDADKLLPASCKLCVLRESGSAPALAAGSRQLLFRYLLKPTEPCTASFDLQASSAALQACTRLQLVDVATGQALTGLAQPHMQLAPAPKGCMLMALAEPHADVPAGAWSVGVTSSQRLQAPVEVPWGRQAVFAGTYAANTQAVLARYVISPSAAVHVALLAQLSLPAGGGGSSAPAPASPSKAGPSSAATSSSSSTTHDSGGSTGAKLPLAYSLQVFDTAGAKEVVWGATYKLLAEAQSQADGRAWLPNLALPPGRYLVLLQLQQQGNRQWVDPVTGSTSPLPQWQLALVPSADDKACPITPDDAWDRHFAATQEAWQQQAAAAAAAAAAGGTSSSTVRPGSTGRMAAAAKDRPKLAQAALERHLAAAAAAAAAEADSRPEAAAGAGATATTAAAAAAAAAPGKPAVALSSPREAAGPSSSSTSAGGGLSGAQGARKAVTAATAHKPKAAVAPAARGAPAGSQSAAAAGGGGAAAAAAAAATGGALSLLPDVGGGSVPSVPPALLGQLWPGAVPAAPGAGCKQPSEAVPRQVKGSGDVMQLSPADQLRWIKAAPAQCQQQQQQHLHGAVLAEALHSRSQLQAAAAAAQADKVAEYAAWRSQCVAEQQGVLGRKQNVLLQLSPPPPVIAAVEPAATAAPAQASRATQSPSAAHGHKGGAGRPIRA